MKRLSANRLNLWVIGIGALSAFALVAGAALEDQDRYALTAPNGIAFSEIRGYDQWQDVAVSTTDMRVKAISGNPALIKAYKKGIPGNGKPFPGGATIVKIEWVKAPNPARLTRWRCRPLSRQFPSSRRIQRDSPIPTNGDMPSLFTIRRLDVQAILSGQLVWQGGLLSMPHYCGSPGPHLHQLLG
jgi:hypothetical protein